MRACWNSARAFVGLAFTTASRIVAASSYCSSSMWAIARFTESVIAEHSREPAITNATRQMKCATYVIGNIELIARHVRASGIDLVVLGKDACSPDVVFIVVTTIRFNQVSLVIVR